MNLAKVNKFLAASLLLFTLLGDTTEACKCADSHPQTAFCTNSIVLRVRFFADNRAKSSYTESSLTNSIIKIIKVYKSPERMQDAYYVHVPSFARCAHSHKVSLQEEYIIAGKLYDEGTVSISDCGFITPWAQLTLEQKRGFVSEYRKGCYCSIVEWLPEGSISFNQCLWADSRRSPNLDDFQYKHMACLPGVKFPGMCSWKSLST